MITKQAGPQVVAVGHLCVDRIYLCREFPAENTSQRILDFSQHAGGTASQAIATLARLGVPVGYLGSFGDDEAGSYLYQDCRKEGIDLSRCVFCPGVVHSFTNVFVNVRRNTRTFLSYHGKFPPLAFTAEKIEYLAQARIVHLDNTDSGNALAAARIAREHGVLVSLDASSMDPDNGKNWELVRMCDILIANETFPGRLTGNPDRRAALLEIDRAVHPQVLLSTAGEHGCMAVADGKITEYPAYRIRPVDTTGAGDVFHGAFLYGLLRGFALAENIRFASAAAAISCGSVGGRDGIPRPGEVEAFMERHPFSSDPESASGAV
jgi:sugar/nucleoside kinase (ribokinase family)